MDRSQGVKDMVSLCVLLLASLDFRETRNTRLSPLHCLPPPPQHILYTGAALTGLFWLVQLAPKSSVCRERREVVQTLQDLTLWSSCNL